MADILIIEDDAPLQEAYGFILRADGHDTTSAYNGREGLEKAKHQIFDIILLDLHMPIMDGWEFLRSYHSDLNPKTKIILFSNMVSEDTHKNAENFGVYKSILKSSMTPSAMLALIHDLTN